METIPETERLFSLVPPLLWTIPPLEVLLSYLVIVLLLVCSALISGSEVALFSLSLQDRRTLRDSTRNADKVILRLLEQPRYLLATILIANNFVNICIIILSSFALEQSLAGLAMESWQVFVVNVVLVTFILVLFGEIAPKVYANINNLPIARLMATPMAILLRIFHYPSSILVKSTQLIEKRLEKNNEKDDFLTRNDLEKAITLTMQEDDEETAMEQETSVLKNIIYFQNLTVRKIMRPRIEVVALNCETLFVEVKKRLHDTNFSRLPVYQGHFDEVVGILYIKDLLPYFDEPDHFDWKSKLRKPFFVEENEKIVDLLKKFKAKKIHLAIVLDPEYGGVSGIVTMEDILEEIIGEIKDESDGPLEIQHVKLEEGVFLFEGRTMLNDVCRIAGIDLDTFEDMSERADSIGGLMIELAKGIPPLHEELTFENLRFEIIAANDRSVKQLKMTILSPEEEEKDEED